ncbi:phage gene 29 protein family protein [Mycolicibacterium houstonense]|uniref:phage gene 29 protein family protein n=1 Tax=Mycolicibacterium houstonense TaxID=146021 RepID=UPI0008351352|nr:DUF2744 domain-containing protein [Mycolicibacterium houstonense]
MQHTQDTADWRDPKKALAWALVGLPHPNGGSNQVTHPAIIEAWSEHLVRVGLLHVDQVRALADADGNIHVSKLPKQELKYQPAVRGPRGTPYNPAARWVPMDTPEPPKFRIQDPRTMTQQEREAQLAIYRAEGWLPDNRPVPSTARVVN